MATLLDDYLAQRARACIEVVPGVAVPACFSDPVAEHLATRRAAGVFDFSFMGCLEVSGPDAVAYLHRLQTRSLHSLAPGRIVYTLLLRADGSVLTDATVWRLGADRFALFLGRRADVAYAKATAADHQLELRDRSDDHAVIAVQGPRAWTIVQQSLTDVPAELPYFGFCSAVFHAAPCWLARLGYSGESGYEIVVAAKHAVRLWRALMRAGSSSGITECGFSALNSLRIEAGYLLFAQELAARRTPQELGLFRLISTYGVDYIGKLSLRARGAAAAERQITGLVPILSPRNTAMTTDSAQAEMTSTTYSPIFGRMLGIGFVRRCHRRPGNLVRLPDGTRAVTARLPFYDPSKHLARRNR